MPVHPADLMDKLGLTVADLARIYSQLGDPADADSIQRRIRRRMHADGGPPGEAIAFLNLLIKVRDAVSGLEQVLSKEKDHGRRRTRSSR